MGNYNPTGNYNDKEIHNQGGTKSDALNQASKDWFEANERGDAEGMKAAHDRAESIRGESGYSGGTDGSEYHDTKFTGIEIGFRDAEELQKNIYKKALENGLGRLENQKGAINTNYDDIAKKAYINYMMEQKALPKQMQNMGILGQGVAESTAANQSNAYMQNVTNSELGKNKALNDIARQMEELQNTNSIEEARALLDIAMQKNQAYIEFMNNQQAQSNWQAQFNQGQQNWQTSHNYNMSQDEIANKFALAKAKADNGDFSGYWELGTDPRITQNNYYRSLYK